MGRGEEGGVEVNAVKVRDFVSPHIIRTNVITINNLNHDTMLSFRISKYD